MRIALQEYINTLLWLAVLFLLFYPLESLGSARPRARTRLANYLYFPVSLANIFVLQALIDPIFARAIELAKGGLLAPYVPVRRTVVSEILFALMFAFLYDIWQYWIHRWQHASTWLWQTHKLHHSDTSVNSSTLARHHPLSHALFMLCYSPFLLVFGALTPHFIASVLMFRVWGLVNHADVRVSFGPFTSLIAGPQWHRIHHSVKAEHFDKNFATFFPFIDRIFGTYYEPARDEYPPTGLLDNESEPFIYESTISPLVSWYRRLRPRLRSPRKASIG